MKKILIFLSFLAADLGAQDDFLEFTMEIKIQCPPSEEFRAFWESIPSGENESVSFEEFQFSFVQTLNQLVCLVESGKIYQSSWWVKPTQKNSSGTELKK